MKDEGRKTKDEGRRTRDEGRRTKDERQINAESHSREGGNPELLCWIPA
jgi:hypothetical protein